MGYRDKNSSYSKLFLERNSLKYSRVETYVRNILSTYNITNYEIKEFKDKGLSLFVYDVDQTFVIYMDEKYVELKLVASENDYKDPKLGYVKDTCWKQAIAEIIKRVG